MIWIILICLNCNVDAARATGWNAEAALAERWERDGAETFTNRRACMRALRREMPEADWSAPDSFGQINKTTHFPDYVETFSSIPLHMNSTANYGCFSAAPPTG